MGEGEAARRRRARRRARAQREWERVGVGEKRQLTRRRTLRAVFTSAVHVSWGAKYPASARSKIAAAPWKCTNPKDAANWTLNPTQ